MSVFGTNNIMDVFVAKEVAPATYANVTSDLLSTLTAGQIAVVGLYASGGYEEKLGAHTVNAANYPYIRFVKKTSSGELLYGSKIYGKDIKNVTTKLAVTPAEQSYTLGYNGTSGSLDVSQGNEFMLTIAYDHDDILWSEQKLRNTYDYYSQAPTQQGLALSMASQINYKETLGVINGTGRMVRAEVLSNGTAADWTGAATHIKVVQDSASVIFTNGSGVAAAGQALTDGTVINIAGTTYTVSGTGTTAGFTLNMPYQGSSAEVAGGTTQATQAGVLTGITSWGIKVVGQPLTWKKDFFKYNKVKFHFDLKNFGSTALTKTSESSKGNGFWQEVAEMESFSSGFQGALNRMVIPIPTGLNEAPTTTPAFAGAASGLGASYCTWEIESYDSTYTSASSGITGSSPMRIQTYICFPAGTQGAAQQADLVNDSNWNVDAWFTAYGFTLTTVPGT